MPGRLTPALAAEQLATEFKALKDLVTGEPYRQERKSTQDSETLVIVNRFGQSAFFPPPMYEVATIRISVVTQDNGGIDVDVYATILVSKTKIADYEDYHLVQTNRRTSSGAGSLN